ncbi:MAG: aspartate/glutamate racemase family protein [Alphaproteobacteria bacterium]
MIGVFDSGHGGLTVLRTLVRRLPRQAFVYLGDHANAPYGGREPDTIYRLTVANVERLFLQGCRLVLLACNTASAVALRRLQQEWLPGAYPDRRVLGVLVPMVEAITAVPWRVKTPPANGDGAPTVVGIFATRRTVDSGAYPLEIGLRAPRVRVVQQPCPALVARIEENAPPDALAAMIAGHVADLLARCPGGRPDSVVLGCTHYPLVADAFAAALPSGIAVLDQPRIVADSLADYLRRHPEFDGRDGTGPAVRFLTTGPAGASNGLATRFFSRPVEFAAIG